MAAIVAAAVAGIGFVIFAGGADTSNTVAIVNADAGTTLDGKELRAGETLVDTLGKNEDFDFQVVDNPDGNYFATLTVPEDFSETVASMFGMDPRQASVDLEVKGSDSEKSAELTRAVSAQVGADGIKGCWLRRRRPDARSIKTSPPHRFWSPEPIRPESPSIR
ncbi:hypothetical protein GCM10020255_041940 [Rhodococcus baikonurensis]